MQHHGRLVVDVLVQVLDAAGVEARRPTDDAVDCVALLEQQLGQVAAVLSSDASDERDLAFPGRSASSRIVAMRTCTPRGSGASRARGTSPWHTGETRCSCGRPSPWSPAPAARADARRCERAARGCRRRPCQGSTWWESCWIVVSCVVRVRDLARPQSAPRDFASSPARRSAAVLSA